MFNTAHCASALPQAAADESSAAGEAVAALTVDAAGCTLAAVDGWQRAWAEAETEAEAEAQAAVAEVQSVGDDDQAVEQVATGTAPPRTPSAPGGVGTVVVGLKRGGLGC